MTTKKKPSGMYRVELTFSRWLVAKPIPVTLPDVAKIEIVSDSTMTITDATGHVLTEDLAELSGVRLTIFER